MSTLTSVNGQSCTLPNKPIVVGVSAMDLPVTEFLDDSYYNELIRASREMIANGRGEWTFVSMTYDKRLAACLWLSPCGSKYARAGTSYVQF